MLIVIFVFSAQQLVWLARLANLPQASGAAVMSGAVYRGTLEGPLQTTPFGHVAVAWIGQVTKTPQLGRSRSTTEVCRFGALSDLRLVNGQSRLAIATPDLAQLELQLELGFNASRLARVRYWLGPIETRSPPLESVIEKCQLDRRALADPNWLWQYSEQAAAPGSTAELTGCLTVGTLRSCGDGVAVGHLSTAGLHAMLRRLADSQLQVIALLTLLMSFFTIVGGVGAVLALRRAASGSSGAP